MNVLKLADKRVLRMPQAIRYLAKKYVDDFFRDGTIQLTRLQDFWKNPDEMRCDRLDGRPLVEVRHPSFPTTLVPFHEDGDMKFVLCASMIESLSIGQRFKEAQHGIHILDAARFFEAIAQEVPSRAGGMMGPCNYTDAVDQADGAAFAALQHVSDPDAQQDAARRILTPHFYDGLFRKRTKFVAEAEFRFIWFSDERHDKPVIVKCPEAVKVCRPFPSPLPVDRAEAVLLDALRASIEQQPSG